MAAVNGKSQKFADGLTGFTKSANAKTSGARAAMETATDTLNEFNSANKYGDAFGLDAGKIADGIKGFGSKPAEKETTKEHEKKAKKKESEKGESGDTKNEITTLQTTIVKKQKNTDDRKTRELYNIIKKAESISTAKPWQAIAPRDLNEQILWNMVKREPQFGIPLPLNSDSRFPHSAGFQKMQANHTLPDGSNITIHYQYNAITGKAYDMKFVTRQNITPELQPGPTFKD